MTTNQGDKTMKRLLAAVLFFALVAPAGAVEPPKPAPYPTADRLAEARAAKGQSDALAAELERELSLARFAAQQAQRAIEALIQIDLMQNAAPKEEKKAEEEPAP